MMDKDIFSFDRLWKLARFYTPAIRLVLIIFGLLLVFAFWISFTGMSIMKSNPENPFGFLLSSLGNSLAGWSYYAGPFVFAFCSRRGVATVLPASWVEKSVFMFGWVFVVYPAILAAIWYSLVGIFSIFSNVSSFNEMAVEMLRHDAPGFDMQNFAAASWLSTAASSMFTVAVTCMMIVYSRRHRIVMGIVGIIGSGFVGTLVGIALGIWALFYTDFIQSIQQDTFTPDSMTNNLLGTIMNSLPIVGIAVICVVIMIMILTVRKIRTCQN